MLLNLTFSDSFLNSFLNNFFLMHIGYSCFFRSSTTYRLVFSLCHLVGMLSALANPILYGYYNQVTLV